MIADPMIDRFRDALNAAGLQTSDQIIADGSLHRFHVEGDHRRKRNGFYVIHLDNYPNASYGCHKRYPGQSLRWSPERSDRLSYEERCAMAIKAKADAKRRAHARRAAMDAAAAKSNLIWEAAKLCEEHSYLTRKRIKPHGLRVAPWIKERPHDSVTGEVRDLIIPDALLVPIRNSYKRIVSLQAIFSDANNPLQRDKDFMAGGEKKGCYFTIGHGGNIASRQAIIIAEGLATAASCYEATGLVSVAAFDCGNLKPVALTLRNRMPECTIIIAADNDRWTLTPISNPGVISARAAAAAVAGLVAIPEFSDLSLRPTDFNDLHVQEGLGEVQRQLTKLLERGRGSRHD
jgi:putative DNA primase/helicase